MSPDFFIHGKATKFNETKEALGGIREFINIGSNISWSDRNSSPEYEWVIVGKSPELDLLGLLSLTLGK